ncbi:MAG TPA: PKD domain-containing protein [Edaphocola sp.]|nr:PKD domain-containing protein [Edaphocola sp.]
MRQHFLKYLFYFFGIIMSSNLYAHENGIGGSAVQFIPNRGQWAQDFLFKGISKNADIYFESKGLRILVGTPENDKVFEDYKMGRIKHNPEFNFHAYAINWIGGNAKPETIGVQPEEHYNNYFLGNDSSRWKGNVPVFNKLNYKNVYSGVDFHFYSEAIGMKYDIILQPQSNLKEVKLEYQGLDNITIEKGNLILTTSVGKVIEQKPYAYQIIDYKKVEVPCNYVLEQNVLSFQLPKGYDKTKELIIDPQIVFASLTGSYADNWGFTATYDPSGNLYAGGIVRGAGYPVSLGALQATYGGGIGGNNFGIDCDISISKFNAVGNNLIYSTYVGGSCNEMPHSLVVDANNNLIISGKTCSNNYPTTTNAYDTSFGGGFDIVISKINATGTAMIGSTYFGGTGEDGVNISPNFYTQTSLKHNYGDDARSEVIVDKQGNIYLAGSIRSADITLPSNAMKSIKGGDQDGLFIKFNPTLSNLIYGTLIGGSDVDGAYSIALDTAENYIYVTGGTASSDFHSSSTLGAYQATNAGGIDGFIMRFQNSGTYPLIRTTFVGTLAYDQIFGVQIDLENSVYVMGQTQGPFPVFPATVYSNPGSSQFVLKLDSTLATGIFSTVFGSGPVPNVNISPVAFLVDTCQNIYISGWGGLTITGPPTSVQGLPITANALQSTTDGADFYFIVLKKNLQSLLYGSYFGSSGIQEHVDGGTSRFDPNGVVYQAICASCGNQSLYPATPGAYSTQKNSNNCNLGVVKIAFNLGSVTTNAQASPSASGCVPFTVNFQSNSTNAISWNWDFGDGSSSNLSAPVHTFTTAGIFNVRLIGYNPDACKVYDTSYVTITVSNDTINSNFNYTILDSCVDFKVSFNNTSTGVGGSILPSGATYNWVFSNGNTFNGVNPPVQIFGTTGTHTAQLIMTLAGACNSPDTVMKSFNFDPIIVSVGTLPPLSACDQTEFSFTNNAVNATSFLWNFGDGGSSTDPNPTHTYTAPGVYTLTLTVTNPASCNKTDMLTTTVTVNPIPTAAFYFTPVVAETNTPFTFFNQSIGANSYLWEFGDGATSTETNPIHEYRRSGRFNVCLTVKNQYGCSSRVCKDIDAIIQPLADVPTGFSPNGDGNNDVLYVRGYGIETMRLNIFNRWGELVFETTNQDIGWDGTYNGKPQEMESYAYVLDVTFLNGTKVKKQGNVTLIR